MSKCYIIYGPTSAGKLTTAKELQKLTNAILVHNHMTVNLCKEIFKWRSDEYESLIIKIRLSIIESIFQKRKGMILTWFYWGDKWDVSFINKVNNLASQYNVDIVAIGLNPNIDILRNRVVSKNRLKNNKPNTIEEFNKAVEGWKFKKIEIEHSLIFDNSNISAKNLAFKIFSYIEI